MVNISGWKPPIFVPPGHLHAVCIALANMASLATAADGSKAKHIQTYCGKICVDGELALSNLWALKCVCVRRAGASQDFRNACSQNLQSMCISWVWTERLLYLLRWCQRFANPLLQVATSNNCSANWMTGSWHHLHSFTIPLFLAWFVSSQKAPNLLKHSCGVGFEPTQRSAAEDLPGAVQHPTMDFRHVETSSPHFEKLHVWRSKPNLWWTCRPVDLWNVGGKHDKISLACEIHPDATIIPPLHRSSTCISLAIFEGEGRL